MNILFEDNYLIICEKPVGVLSESSDKKDDMVSIVSEYLKCPAYLVHRLDSGTGGVMVLAKTSDCASKLSTLIQNREFFKEYLAVINGCPSEKEGVYEDLLFRDSHKNKSYVVKRERKGVKKASLEFHTIASLTEDDKILSLEKIKLHTGRTHQIRVQFSSRNMPLLGDIKYGSKCEKCGVSLWSYRISFLHPYTKKEICCKSLPEKNYPWNLFQNIEEI